MKFFHIAIIIIPITSIIIIGFYLTNIVGTKTPLTITISGSNPPTLHEGDKFRLVIVVYNPYFVSIPYFSSETTFDKNAIYHHIDGCACCHVSTTIDPSRPTEMTLPLDGCYENIANSTGETNATVHLQYKINNIQYDSSASKIFTILPKTGN